MGKQIPSATDVAKKWRERAEGAADELVKGAKASTWKTDAVAGEANFKTAMTTVINKELRKKGIEKSSDAMWQKGIEDNKDRYPAGVKLAETEMATAMNVVLSDIKAEMPNLPKKGVKNSEDNWKRSKQLGSKLHTQAESRKGA